LVISLSETWLRPSDQISYFTLDGYTLISKSRKEEKRGGGVGVYISKKLSFVTHDDLADTLSDICDCCIIEIVNDDSSDIVVISVYRPPDTDISLFVDRFSKLLKGVMGKNSKQKQFFITADWNIDLLKISVDDRVDKFLDDMLSYGLLPSVTLPNRITERSAILIDNIVLNCHFNVHVYYSRKIYDYISDHFPILICIKKCLPSVPFTVGLQNQNYAFSERNFTKFQNLISQEDWFPFDTYNLILLSPHEAYTNFENLFRANFEVAYKKDTELSNASPREKNLPWLTDGLIKSCKKVSSA